jgi:hypothetical protein
MSEVPTSVYDVRDIRNSGWPTGRESYGHAVLGVVDGVTPIPGDGNAAHRAKQDRPAIMGNNDTEGCVMLPGMFQRTITRRMNRKMIPNLKPVGEPDAEKLARPVRRGAVGKAPQGYSLAAYPTVPAVLS